MLKYSHDLDETKPAGEVSVKDLKTFLETDLGGDLEKRSSYLSQKMLSAVDENGDDTFNLYELFENLDLGTCLPKGLTSGDILTQAMDVLVGDTSGWARIDLEVAFNEVMEALDLAELDDCHLVERKDLKKWNAVHNELRKNGIFGYYNETRRLAASGDDAATI